MDCENDINFPRSFSEALEASNLLGYISGADGTKIVVRVLGERESGAWKPKQKLVSTDTVEKRVRMNLSIASEKRGRRLAGSAIGDAAGMSKKEDKAKAIG